MFVLDASIDVSEPRAAAVLMTFQRVEVDGVGEVRGEELVGLVFEPSTIRGEFRQLVGACREPFVECLLDLLGETDVLGFVDADAGVAVGDELLSDRNGDCARRALGFAGATAAAAIGSCIHAPGPCSSSRHRMHRRHSLRRISTGSSNDVAVTVMMLAPPGH
ncbi:hypothetical protein [Humibacter antri]